MEILLVPVSLVILIATPILFFSNSSNAKRIGYKKALVPLNLAVLLYSAISFIAYFEPASNPMWILAVAVPVVLLLVSSINLLYLLKSKIDRTIVDDQRQTNDK